LAAAAMVIMQSLCYAGAKIATRRRTKRSFFCRADARVPFVPWTVAIYISAFIFWPGSYLTLAVWDGGRLAGTLLAQLMGSIACGVCFIASPTEIDLPPLPRGVWGWVLGVVRRADSPPVNLFPSMHCMASVICAAGFLGSAAPPAIQAASIVWALLISISPVTVKQHYLPDVLGGLILGGALSALCLGLDFPAGAITLLTRWLGL
jgi:membrane-associated phospholipid phosphatase